MRHTQFGEGDYKADEAAVRELLLRRRRAPAAAADDRHRDHEGRRCEFGRGAVDLANHEGA